MKVTNKIKTALMVGVTMLTISACGTNTSLTSSLAAGTYGSCSASATGTNIYTGTILSCSDVDGGCLPYETPVSGNVVLSVIGSSGLVSGQASISAALTVNGSAYCCTSQGMSILTAPNALEISSGAKAILNNVALVCQPSGTSTGYFGGYQALTLSIGVGVYAPYTMITSSQRLQGDISITSGTSIGGYSNSLPEYVQ